MSLQVGICIYIYIYICIYIYIRICLEGDAPQDFLLVQLDPIKWFTTSIYLNPSYVTLYQVFLVSGALQVGILSQKVIFS